MKGHNIRRLSVQWRAEKIPAASMSDHTRLHHPEQRCEKHRPVFGKRRGDGKSVSVCSASIVLDVQWVRENRAARPEHDSFQRNHLTIPRASKPEKPAAQSWSQSSGLYNARRLTLPQFHACAPLGNRRPDMTRRTKWFWRSTGVAVVPVPSPAQQKELIHRRLTSDQVEKLLAKLNITYNKTRTETANTFYYEYHPKYKILLATTTARTFG